MKLHNRLFRTIPNSMFVSKSEESVEGGGNKVITSGEITFTSEELLSLMTLNPVVFQANDPRLEVVKNSNIIKVTNLDVASYCYDLKEINDLPFHVYVVSFMTLTSILTLTLAEDTDAEGEEKPYIVRLVPAEFVDSETYQSGISDLQGQITNLQNTVNPTYQHKITVNYYYTESTSDGTSHMRNTDIAFEYVIKNNISQAYTKTDFLNYIKAIGLKNPDKTAISFPIDNGKATQTVYDYHEGSMTNFITQNIYLLNSLSIRTGSLPSYAVLTQIVGIPLAKADVDSEYKLVLMPGYTISVVGSPFRLDQQYISVSDSVAIIN